jgi:hypothetical protein
VKVVVKNKGTAEQSLEYLSFYLRNFEVLDSVSQPYMKVKTAVCV